MVQADRLTGQPEILLIVGPTGSGKSRLAEKLALERGGEIINADSQQFYRGMDIGTGKSDSKGSPVKHWLLDICEPGEWMSAGVFAKEADAVIQELASRDTLPIVVGGTGLYLRALLEGLDALPPRNPEVRERLKAEWAEGKGASLYRRLMEADPALAARIHPNDPVRIIRFLEIYECSGRPPSQILSPKRPDRLRYPTKTLWLSPPREKLREGIAHRVRAMMKAGWLEEVEDLLKKGSDPRGLPNKPIGYTDLADAFHGKIALDEAVDKIILKTQQYAKRQETFFRGLFRLTAYESKGSEVRVLTSWPAEV